MSSGKPMAAAEKPPKKEKVLPVVDHLVREKLAEKQIQLVPGPNGTTIKRAQYRPTPLGAALAAMNGWKLGDKITLADYRAGEKKFKSKTAGSNVTDRLKKGGK